MIDLFSEGTRRDPAPAYAALRARAPLHDDPQKNMTLVVGYDAVKRVLTDHEAFGSTVAGGAPGKWLIFADPPRHTRLRALVSRAFTPRSTGEMEAAIRALSDELLKALPDEGEVEFVEAFSVPLPMKVIAAILGAPAEDWALFRRWSDAMLGLISTLSGGEAAAQAERAFFSMTREMTPYVATLLASRRAAPKEDLLTRLALVEVDGDRLSDDEVLAFFQLLLLAGHETTTNLIANAALVLAGDAPLQGRLADDPALLPCMLEEVLRHRSPVQAMFRVARRDVELDGGTVPGGRLVLAVLGAANRDPSYFADADVFDPERSPNRHLSFGHGIHFCVGAPLARLEAKIALAGLLSRFRWTSPEADCWTPRPAFHVHGPSRLRLQLAPRSRA